MKKAPFISASDTEIKSAFYLKIILSDCSVHQYVVENLNVL